MDDELQKLAHLDTPDLLAKARQVAELAAHPGWKVLNDFARLQREAQTLYITASPPRSQAEYAMAGGIVRGIDYVLKAPERIARIAEERERAERALLEGPQNP